MHQTAPTATDRQTNTNSSITTSSRCCWPQISDHDVRIRRNYYCCWAAMLFTHHSSAGSRKNY